MSKTLEGMARAWWSARGLDGDEVVIDAEELEGMKRAVLFLADNVSDEMADVVAQATSGDEFRQQPEEDYNEWMRRLRKAAIRAVLLAAVDGR